MTAEERLNYFLGRHKELEYRHRQAEIALGIVEKNLREVEKEIAYYQWERLTESRPATPPQQAREEKPAPGSIEEDIVRMFDSGMGVHEIHEHTKGRYSVPRIRICLKAAGKMKGARKLKPPEIEEILAEIAAGKSNVEIAAKRGLHEKCIYKIKVRARQQSQPEETRLRAVK